MLRRIASALGRMDLRFMLFVALFVGSIGGGSAYSLQRLETEVVASAKTVVALHARAIEDQLTQSLAVVDEAIAHTLPDKADPLEARRLQGILEVSPSMRSISVLDDAGERIVVSTNPANVGVRVDTRDFLPQVGKPDLLRIGRPWAGRDFADGVPAGAAALPKSPGLGFIPLVRGAGEEGDGPTVIVALNPDFFASRAAARLEPDEGTLEVLRYDGAVMLTAEGPAAPDEAPRGAAFLSDVAEVEVGSLEETLADGQVVLTSFRASRKFPLLVVVRITRRHALVPWARERSRLLGFVLPGLLGVLGLAVPISIQLRRREERRVEERHRERERLAAAVFQTVDSGVAISDGALRVIAVNPAFTAITGYAEEELAGRHLEVLMATLGSEAHLAVEAELAAAGSWQGEIWNRHKDGRSYLAWLSINQVRGGGPNQYVVALSDITERKASEERIRHLAHHDPLTGLPNRAAFWDRMEQALARARRERGGPRRLSLLYIDLDNFKPGNDTLGHHAGDLLLQGVAGRMTGSLRGSDTVARLGGDEFAVLLPAIEGPEDAMVVAEKIRAALAEPFDVAGQTVSISSSIGVAVYPDDGETEADLTKHADDAMYRAKARGRNRIVSLA